MLDIKDCKPLDQKFVSALVLEFFESKPNLSEDSKKTYSKQIKKFFDFCSSKKIKKPRKQTVLDFISTSLYQRKSAEYINNILVAIRNLFKYLEANEIYPDITKLIERVKQKRGHKRSALYPDQFKRILEAMPKETIFNLRDFAIINLMGRSGIRRKGVSDLKRRDLYQRENSQGQKVWFINVKLKGHDVADFELYLPDPAVKPVLEYLESRGTTKANDPLFANRCGSHISDSEISKLFKKSARRVGIDDPKVTCHSMRHMVATIAKSNNKAMEDISDTLGHAQLSTTSDIYTHRGEQGKINVLDSINKILGE